VVSSYTHHSIAYYAPPNTFSYQKYTYSFINPRRPIFATMIDGFIERQDCLILPQNAKLSKKSGQITQETKLRKGSSC
jgi:hypothetical protein